MNMKTAKKVFLIFLVAVTGCATRARVVVQQAVGPARAVLARRRNSNGSLVVYSAMEVINAADARHPAHSSYRIYMPDGKLLRDVDNREGSFYQDPIAVPLAPGKYNIEARATNVGWVELPVIIEQGRTTVVDLDGDVLPPHEAGNGEWVRLPGGQIVGSRAQ